MMVAEPKFATAGDGVTTGTTDAPPQPRSSRLLQLDAESARRNPSNAVLHSTRLDACVGWAALTLAIVATLGWFVPLVVHAIRCTNGGFQ